MNELYDVSPPVVHGYLQDGNLHPVSLGRHACGQSVMESVEFEPRGCDALFIHALQQRCKLLRIVLEYEAAAHHELSTPHPSVSVRCLQNSDSGDLSAHSSAAS